MLYAKMPAFTVIIPAAGAVTLRQAIETAAGAPWNISTTKLNLNAGHFQVKTQGVRMCPDGNTPTAANGLVYTAGAEINPINGSHILDTKWISSTGTDATMTVFLGEAEPNRA